MNRPGNSRGWIGLGWFLVLLVTAHPEAVPVYRGAEIVAPIYVGPDAAPAEREAAADLSRVLGVMSGMRWSVQESSDDTRPGIYLGRRLGSAAAGLRVAADWLASRPGEVGPDAFRIRSGSGRVMIEAATPEATGFAVSWLLQRTAGVRWFAPGAIGENILRRAAWSVPVMDVVREPAYLSREITGLQSADGIAWMRHNGLQGRWEFTHALREVFPPAVMATHPDWAPLLEGLSQGPVTAADDHWQPNLALPAVADQAAKMAAAAFAADPGRRSFSLGINDTVRFDQSQVTREKVEPLGYFRGRPDYSGLVFSFMNGVAARLEPDWPDRYLGCLAYFWAENAPPFPVNRRVLPYLTADRSQYYDRRFRREDLALMSRWSASGVAAFGLWEYAYGQGFLIPREPLRSLAEGVREGWRRGARGYFAEMNPNWGFDAGKAWILARLLWEPDRSDRALAEEFYDGYFGPAARPMRSFFERCESQWMTQGGAPSWLKYRLQIDQARLFPPETCRDLRQLLAAAARAAAGDRMIAARVGQTSRAFAVTEALADYDRARRAMESPAGNFGSDADLAGKIGRLVRADQTLREKFTAACAGPAPAMGGGDLSAFTGDDPVPRALWLAGQRDPAAPRRLLELSGPAARARPGWRALADVVAAGSLTGAPDLTENGSFAAAATGGQEPRFLFPKSGAMPAAWEVRAMPTEQGRVALAARAEPARSSRCLRIEGQWELQCEEWLPAEPGRVYVATAVMRGQTGLGARASLNLRFFSTTGRPVGTPRADSLPTGAATGWESLVVADRAPPATAWVTVGIGCSRQGQGDWLEVSQVELKGVPRPAS